MSIPSNETVRRIVTTIVSDAAKSKHPIRIVELKQAAGVTDEELDAFFRVFLNRGLFTVTGPPRSGGQIRPHRLLANELQRFGGRAEHITLNNMLQVGNSLVSRDNGYVPPNGKMWVDHIRKKANEATHEIPHMERGDAIDLITFSEMLLKFIYEFPNRVPAPEAEQ